MGGVLKAAMIGEPPSLDLHSTTAVITQQITWHVYETLYTFDKGFAPVPMLAQGHTLSDGGRRYTIALRRGVRFHNGKEMTAADVVASLNRWGKISTPGKPLWKNVEAVEARDPYTVVIHLKEPSASLLFGLARPNAGAAIHPREVIEAAGDGPIKEYIGTGPFRFVEHKPDRHIKLARFKDYAARAEPPDGYGGRRTAYVDEILFLPVPDVAVRLAGVETGEYHFAQQIKPDQYDRVKGLAAVEARVVKPYGWITAVPNHKEGLMTSKKIRQAFQAVLDMEPIMGAAMGNRDFYRLDGALFYPEQAAFYSTAGTAGYNQKDKDKARRLLKEAGYAGQPVRWITTREYEWMYKTAIVAKQQMEEVGFKVDLQVLDWATLVQRRNKPELFDVFSTGYTFQADPALATSVQCNWPGWWCHEEKERVLADLARESDA
jgi:peptide/nickel transport system substrate-binding protein